MLDALLLAPGTLTAIQTHAMAEYPTESCGYVDTSGYHQLVNVAPDGEHTFDCNAQLAPLLAAGDMLALVHSHPDGPESPSTYDMGQQLAMAVPWGLVSCNAEAALPPWYWSDDFEPPPLLNRPFRYGPSGTDGRGDCAALVRDWYRLNREVLLPEFPRENMFWLRPGVSYRQNMLTAGFRPADRQAPEIGDVFLAAIRSSVPNHAGIYLGSGLIMHHLQDRFSRIDPAITWMRFVTDWFRYGG